MYTTADLSTQQLAELLHVTPRMVNIYRSEAEQLTGQKLGVKRGKVVFFTPEEQETIRSVQQRGVGSNKTQPQHPDFSAYNAQAEDSTLNGMEALVAANDQQAIAIGTAIGQRFTQVMWATAIGTMQTGTTQMLQQFAEMGSAIALPLNHQPALQGSDPTAPQLEGYDD